MPRSERVKMQMAGRRRAREHERAIAQEKAAFLFAQDRLSQRQVAAIVGVSKRGVRLWLKSDSFMNKVQDFAMALAERSIREGISQKEKRINTLNTIHEKLLQVIRERANDPEMVDIPGGETGLIVRRLKGIGKGEDFQIVEEYKLDLGLIREIREVQHDAADELGQLVRRQEISGPNGGPIEVGTPELHIHFTNAEAKGLPETGVTIDLPLPPQPEGQ